MSILVIAEHDNQTLNFNTHKVISAAKQLQGEIHLLVMGHDCAAVG